VSEQDARVEEAEIVEREKALRTWFTRQCDPIRQVIDGLDIGWGGVQRWATARMPPPTGEPHLDFACGYGTFLAQLGWRFPNAHLVGLNIDFDGPHALAPSLLAKAEVEAVLVQADARKMPFVGSTFGSVSCFLGLQDIELGFGEEGLRAALAEAVRVLRPDGMLTLVDEFPLERFDALLGDLPATVINKGERELDIRWSRRVAERAVTLYAEGWVTQARLDDSAARKQLYNEVHARMTAEMERQLAAQGYYVPFKPMHLVVARRAFSGG
jgi:SAM-dependent methyltransferase